MPARTGGYGLNEPGTRVDLPTPRRLYREVWRDILFSPKYRDLTVTMLVFDLLSAGFIISIVWLFVAGIIPIHLSKKTFRAFMLCIMSTLFMLTNIHGCFITAAVILRMTKRGNGRPYCGESQAIKKHWRGILALTLFTTFYRIIHILANQLICPLCGAFVLPPLIARISRYRKHVGLQEQLDMMLTIMLCEDLGFWDARARAIEYMLSVWGDIPIPTVVLDKAPLPAILLSIFGGALPLIIIGRFVLKSVVLTALGITIIVTVVTFIQYTRPLCYNVYHCAAYLCTEQDVNDIWSNPDMATHAFYSLTTKDKEAGAIKASDVKLEDGVGAQGKASSGELEGGLLRGEAGGEAKDARPAKNH